MKLFFLSYLFSLIMTGFVYSSYSSDSDSSSSGEDAWRKGYVRAYENAFDEEEGSDDDKGFSYEYLTDLDRDDQYLSDDEDAQSSPKSIHRSDVETGTSSSSSAEPSVNPEDILQKRFQDLSLETTVDYDEIRRKLQGLKSKGWTQRQLANELKVSESTVSVFLREHINRSLSILTGIRQSKNEVIRSILESRPTS